VDDDDCVAEATVDEGDKEWEMEPECQADTTADGEEADELAHVSGDAGTAICDDESQVAGGRRESRATKASQPLR
jgi:hypothetical protein